MTLYKKSNCKSPLKKHAWEYGDTDKEQLNWPGHWEGRERSIEKVVCELRIGELATIHPLDNIEKNHTKYTKLWLGGRQE